MEDREILSDINVLGITFTFKRIVSIHPQREKVVLKLH